jgi:hypothetical protein
VNVAYEEGWFAGYDDATNLLNVPPKVGGTNAVWRTAGGNMADCGSMEVNDELEAKTLAMQDRNRSVSSDFDAELQTSPRLKNGSQRGYTRLATVHGYR